MDRNCYQMMERHMQLCMQDSAHDKEHVYRVLYNALAIAGGEKQVDYEVLIAACLLHDIGRKEQYENPSLCHAQVGSQKAFDFLTANRWDREKAAHVRDCILTHRYRSGNPPESIEAKILFDADKLDAAGAMGIARTIMYKALVGEPLYTVGENGTVFDGSGDEPPSFFHEYHFKLKKLYDNFYTKTGRALAEKKRRGAEAFYQAMLAEVKDSRAAGRDALERALSKGEKSYKNV
ncbi:MAG: HD domain-containing protein [Clostridium sp.]|nr:HD domain-containing protein [Clostridium sp.]